MSLNDAIAKNGEHGGGTFGMANAQTVHVCLNFIFLKAAVFDDFKVNLKQFYRHVEKGDERYKEKMMYYINFKAALMRLHASDEKDELERAFLAMLGKVKKEVVSRNDVPTTVLKNE